MHSSTYQPDIFVLFLCSLDEQEQFQLSVCHRTGWFRQGKLDGQHIIHFFKTNTVILLAVIALDDRGVDSSEAAC